MVSSMTHANFLLGKWRSDEERTLQEVQKIPALPEKFRELFENNFFGKLVFEFTKNKIYSEFDGETSEGSYKVVRSTDESITVRARSSLLQEDEETTYYLDGEAIYTIVSKYDFREYFKRIK